MLSGMGNLSPDAAKMSDAKTRVSMKDLAALLRFTGTSKFSIVLLILAAIFSGGLQVVAPAFLGKTIDNMGEAGNVDLKYLGTHAMILLGMYLIAALFTWVVSYFANVVAAKTALEVRKALSLKLTKLPVSFYDTHPQGDTATHFINDADAILMGVGVYDFICCLIGTMLMSKSCGLDDAAWWNYMCVIMTGLVISIILGAAVGVLAKDQMAATSLSVPVMCIFTFLPMMAQFNGTIAKVAKFFYTQQLYLALTDINNVKIGTEGLIIVLANAVVIIGFFIFAFHKEGLTNE